MGIPPAGRSLQSIDQLNKTIAFTFETAGNQLSVRDPNNVGQDFIYDALDVRDLPPTPQVIRRIAVMIRLAIG